MALPVICLNNVKYLAETNHIVVYDYINNVIFEGNLNLEVTNENN